MCTLLRRKHGFWVICQVRQFLYRILGILPCECSHYLLTVENRIFDCLWLHKDTTKIEVVKIKFQNVFLSWEVGSLKTSIVGCKRIAIKPANKVRLFYYLNCTCGTLSFACSADETVAYSYRNGFSVFHFENTNWACIHAGFVSVAFGLINNYFYHSIYLW